MDLPKLLDSHIHLWPSTSLSSENHGWMTPGLLLAKRHGIFDYNTVTSSSPIRPSGFIYVETDRYLPTPTPDISTKEVTGSCQNEETRKVARQKLEKWAHEPLEELKFLRRIVEGKPADGDGFDAVDGDKMVGCVIWAPFHLPTELFDLYLQFAEEVSGPQLWNRVVGFRYLIQGIKEEATLWKLLDSQSWVRNLLRLRQGRNGKGWTFDIGVDTHSGGVWQVEKAAEMVDEIREIEEDGKKGRVRFILNHLCKPDLSTQNAGSSSRWLAAMKRLAARPGVYMKFSGAFNEFAPEPTPKDTQALLDRLRFYAKSVIELFGVERVMFGSDWPVCNVGGPNGEEGNWKLWREVMERSLKELEVGGKENVWWRSGCEAYAVEI